jgi:hypothetical protein
MCIYFVFLVVVLSESHNVWKLYLAVFSGFKIELRIIKVYRYVFLTHTHMFSCGCVGELHDTHHESA